VKVGIKDYFERKRRMGFLAKLSEEQIISLMIDGLDIKMINSFNAIKPKTFSHFYEIAKAAEESMKRNYIQSFDKNKFRQKPINTVKPPKSCFICEKKGLKNRFHWVKDCFNKNNDSSNYRNRMNNKPNQNTSQLNNIESENDGFDEIKDILN